MITTRVLSNISYNSEDYFAAKIVELQQLGVIDWAYWIFHIADEDEKKDHIHFVFKPSKRLDTVKLREAFFEFDAQNPTKPLTCTMRFNPCNSMDDWLLYVVHDQNYLNFKGQYRRFHYSYDDLKATDYDALAADWSNIDRRKYYLLQWLEDAVLSSTPFYVLVQQGLVPISQRSQYEHQYKSLWRAHYAEVNGYSNRVQSHEEEDDLI